MTDIELTADELAPENLDFDDAELVPIEGSPYAAALRVRGTAPCMNMKVRLIPVRYIQQPDYWAIHVVGDLPGGFCLEAIRPFDEVLAPAPEGKKGVVVIGKTKRVRLESP